MKTIAALFAIFGIGVLSWGLILRHRTNRIDNPPTLMEDLPRLRGTEDFAILDFCTNRFVGFTRLVSASKNDYDDNPYKWSAHVTAERVNKLGGIDRESATVRFAVSGFGTRSIYCLEAK